KCRSLGMRSCLVINGSLLTKENIDNLYMHRPDVLQISLVNIYPEKHHKLRNTTVEFSTYMDRITDAVAMFVDEKPDIMDIHTDIGIQTDNYSGFRGKKHLIYKKLGILDPGDPSINVTIRDIKPHLIGFLEKVEKKSSKFRLSREQVDKNIRVYYSKPYTNGRSVAYDFGNGHKIYYHPFFTGRKRNQWYPVTRGSCRLPFLGILADGRVTLCLQDYDANVTIGSILEDELGTILERNKELIKKHKMHGKIPFEICRSCLGSPTRHGALIKNIRNTILSFLR
ncbi:MAG: SPASM domain-containing protein, partial [Thermodesulfovibrionales bacterium]|nr:SPASM domain-containing protein [Thermodesulfovibrionales bacterium]